MTAIIPPRIVLFLSALAVLALSLSTLAGPITPPVGPVASTAKPLAEIEPRIAINATNTPGDADSLFKITQPGSYYLTGNVAGVAAKHGIEIAASVVTLDLNGFVIDGQATLFDFNNAYNGINAPSSVSQVAVVNGTIYAWSGGAVIFESGLSKDCRVAGVNASSNLRDSIKVGTHSTVAGCIADSNGSTGSFSARGISTGTDCTVTNCTASKNSSDGILTGLRGLVTNCSANSNSGDGIQTGTGSTVSNCTASMNTEHGFNATDGCAITACTAQGNTLIGIKATANTTIANCTASGNLGANGIVTTTGGTIIGCTANTNASNGITTGAGCSVRNCSTYHNNNSSGITVGDGSSVFDCTSGGNAGDGIIASNYCHVRGNTCMGNGVGAATGAGVNVTGILNRIEANACGDADYGIFVAGTRNILIRNTCESNLTNWRVLAGNNVAPIISSSTNGALINGDSYTGSLGSTDPNANFTH